MKFRNFIILFILVFVINPLCATEAQKKVKWEDERIASVKVVGFSYDEIWGKMLNVLLFKKFTPWGASIKIRHEVVIVEKDSGLIVLRGITKESVYLHYYSGIEDYKYIFKVMIQETNGQIIVKCRCDGIRGKEVIEEFFQLFKKDFKDLK